MSVRVGPAESPEEREQLYRFRYRVYVEELDMTQEADHEGKRLVDDLDAHATSFAVFEDGEVLGSLRIAYLDQLPDPSALIAKFDMQPAVDALGAGAICTTSRFILDRRLRHGTVLLRLLRAGFKHTTERGVKLNYGDCSPHLLPFYEHLGYRRYTRGYNDTAFGYKIPIVMLLGDLPFFERVRSPLARLARKHPQDDTTRVWFGETYPRYAELESAAFLPDDVFFDLLAERVASDPLHGVFLLRGLGREEADRFLAKATLIELQEGDLIIREGDRDETLFVLLSGLAEVALGDPDSPPVAVFGAGDTFGEIGFLTSVPRTANVVARTKAQVLVLSSEFMERFIAQEPATAAKVLLNLSRELAGRLAHSNTTRLAPEAG